MTVSGRMSRYVLHTIASSWVVTEGLAMRGCSAPMSNALCQMPYTCRRTKMDVGDIHCALAPPRRSSRARVPLSSSATFLFVNKPW